MSNLNEIYNRVYEDLSDILFEMGFLNLSDPPLVVDELLPVFEMELFLAEAWSDEEHYEKIIDIISKVEWDLNKNFDATPAGPHSEKDNIVAINEPACLVFGSFFGYDKDSFLEIIVLYVLAKWLFRNTSNGICYPLLNEDSIKINNLSEEFLITWAQLFVYKIIEDRAKMVNMFNDICTNLSPKYSLWQIVKSRSFKEIVLDMVTLRHTDELSLSSWRTIMQNDDFWLEIFKDPRIDREKVVRFFNDDDAYRTIGLWFEKELINYEVDLLPYTRTLAMEIKESFFERYSMGLLPFDMLLQDLSIKRRMDLIEL